MSDALDRLDESISAYYAAHPNPCEPRRHRDQDAEDDYLETVAERRAEERDEPMSGPECDRVADFDAIKRGAA